VAELKTLPTKVSIDTFLERIADEARRGDCRTLVRLMKRATGERPTMWGPSMVGFGSYHYRYASGHEGDCFLAGFAPRKRELTLYIMSGFDRYNALMARLGKFRTGKACLYVKRLDDIDLAVLEELVSASVKHLKQWYRNPGVT
jgi:hypothetical protein